MPSIDKASQTAPHAPTLKPGGLGNLEKLPSELIQLAVDQLVDEPHALAGFAAVTKLALEHTNQSLKGLVPPTHQTTSSRLEEWTAHFRTLTPVMQQVLKATAGLLPCPDIFSSIEDEDIKKLHDPLAETIRHLDSIIPHRARNSFKLMEDNAKAAGVPVPDATEILLATTLRNTDDFESATLGLELMEKNAKAAGVPVPDATERLLTVAMSNLGAPYGGNASFALYLMNINAKAAGVPVPDATKRLQAAATRKLYAGDLVGARHLVDHLRDHAEAAGVPLSGAAVQLWLKVESFFV